RNDPGDIKADFFAAVSSDGGLTFSRNARLSAGPSDATDAGLTSAARNFQYGDYTGLVFQGGTLYLVWADNSAELGLNPNLPEFDLAVGRAPTAHVADAPLTAKALDITADVGAEGERFSADLAEFTDADPNARPVSHYSAVIDWGDQTTPTAGVIRL